jgi:hypothetical protein
VIQKKYIKKKIVSQISVASLLLFLKHVAHQRQDETKQPPPPPSTEAHTMTTTTSNTYLSTHLIVPYFINSNGEIKRPEHLIAWWSRIFSFLCVPLTIKIVLNYVFFAVSIATH